MFSQLGVNIHKTLKLITKILDQLKVKIRIVCVFIKYSQEFKKNISLFVKGKNKRYMVRLKKSWPVTIDV